MDLRQGTTGSLQVDPGGHLQTTSLGGRQQSYLTFQFALIGLGTITTLKLFHLLTLPRCMCQDLQLATTLFSG